VTAVASELNPAGSPRLRAARRSVARQSTSGASQTTARTTVASGDRSRKAPMIAAPIDQP